MEVASDNAFTSIVSSGNVISNAYALSGLTPSTQYFWRVKGKNFCGEGSFSSVFSFTTVGCTTCAASGSNAFDTSTTLVKFNTIENASTKLDGNGSRQGYFDYTSMSTIVKLNESHDLTVNVNTDGVFRVQVKAWIDWNQNCSFDDAGEEYDLGFAVDTGDGPTDVSPFTITIPSGASLGSTIMRVSSRYTDANITYPTSCETNFDGEVEDYTLNIQDATASLEDVAFSGFNLFPNPTKGAITLNLELVNKEKVTVQLFDVRGRLIDEKVYDNNTISSFSEKIIFDKAAAGLYLLKVTNGNKQTTKKLIIK